MKKLIYSIALMTCGALAHGQTPAENMSAAEARVECAKAEVVAAEKAFDATIKPYKKDAKMQIKANDKEIADLRHGLVKPFKSPANDESKKKIDDLENRNIDLRNRLYIDQK